MCSFDDGWHFLAFLARKYVSCLRYNRLSRLLGTGAMERNGMQGSAQMIDFSLTTLFCLLSFRYSWFTAVFHDHIPLLAW
jgi:hypothetical protein